jgi:hypothetical protein
VQQAVLDDFPGVNINVMIIWIDILPADNIATAKRMARTLVHPRVRHFYDPRPHPAGTAFRGDLVKSGPTWDIYMLYGKSARWNDAPPKPDKWWHQLSGGRRADPDRYAAGELEDRLHDSMHEVTGATCGDH